MTKRWWGLVLCCVTLCAAAQNPKTYIHDRAKQYIPIILQETKTYFPEGIERAYVPALIEHESCISLKHSRCWSPQSELKTSRERGVGLGQITKAFKADGSIRFDALAGLKAKYKQDLQEVTWDNVKYRPELQIRMIILMVRDEYRGLYMVSDPYRRYQFADSAYNGGRRDVLKARQVCGLAAQCDPQHWFDHTERYNVKSRKLLYGNRSARDINNHHVRDVFETRLPKFRQYVAQLKGPPYE